MHRTGFLFVCVFVCSAALDLTGREVHAQPAKDSLFRGTISHLGISDLSADQIAQIKELAAKSAPLIRDAELQAAESDAQRRTREEETQKSTRRGLRGAPARKLLMGATSRTPQQRSAFQRAARLRREFDQAVNGVLTESQRAEIQKPDRRIAAPTGFLIVQLSPQLPLPPKSAETLADTAAALDLPKLRAVIAQRGLTKSERAVKTELLDRVDDARNKAISDEVRLLRAFWQIDVRETKTDDVKSTLKSLAELPEVEEAYMAFEPGKPSLCSSVSPSDDPYFPLQGYLAPAPEGIDAAAAWSICGGQGAGVGLVDLEAGWNIEHEDLHAVLREPIYGDRLPGDDHGTSVVGEIVAQDNAVGVVGAAPCVDYVALTSLYHLAQGAEELHIANALIAALFIMDPGDVALIEFQTEDLAPAETETLNYRAIRLAVLMGMIVIEPTGNGRHDLDAFLHNGMKILNRNDPSFRDSGAIMVGASDPRNGHNKARASCYGSRVDCFGWGNQVTTTSGIIGSDIIGNHGGDPNKGYRSSFNATSAAAPIIAGAALLIQGLSKAKYGAVLSPSQMRAFLSDPATGTPQGTAVPGHIGVMPNLRAIIEARGLGVARSSTPGVSLQADQYQFRHCRYPRKALLKRRR